MAVTMPIRPGLTMGTNGDEVAALHDALAVIGFQIDPAERDAKLFGASTVAAVMKLQALAGIEQSGAVDDNTIAVISLALDRLGIRPGEAGFVAAPTQFAVGGVVTDASGDPLAKVRVIAFDCDLRVRQELGRSVSDETGAYRISYDASKLIAGHRFADLQVEAHGPRGKILLSSPIMFSAPAQTTIDLPLGGPDHAQASEFATITASVAPLLGNLTPTELQEDNEYQDLSFLSGQTGTPVERLAFWTIAARLAASTALPAELFYGLLRGGVSSNAHVVSLAATTDGVDLDTNAQTLLEGILSTSSAALAAAVASAVDSNLIPASYATQASGDLGQLAKLSNAAALNSTLAVGQAFGKTSLSDVLTAVSIPADVQERFATLYASAVGSARLTFWTDLAENPSFTAQQVADLRFATTVGRLTRGYQPLITALADQRAAGKISGARDLARLRAADWVSLLKQKQANGKPIGVPSSIAGATPAVNRQRYASMLERYFTQTYPTTAFSARLAADRRTPFPAAAPTADFLDANAALDLRITNLDAFSLKTPIPDAVRQTLLTAQRLIKVNSDYSVMSALLKDGISTAQQIYFMGRDRFVSEYSSLQALGATGAARMWACAEQTYAVALATATKFNATLGAASPTAVGPVLPLDVQTQVAAFPNLQTLFGSDSVCACSDCESVLGAAAYLVDMLEFLSQRSAGGGSNVRDVLLSRRPDIKEILLSCPNTDTPLPYIDLVNELLEDAVAPPADPIAAARARQTAWTADELNANPEYVNSNAYTTLASAVYPWTLPFDLPLAEAKTYLAQIGLSRAQLIETFQKPAGYPSDQADALAREQLELSAFAADIITAGPLASAFNSWDYWGLTQTGNTIVDPDDPTKTVTGSWLDVLAQVRVLLARAGLDYQELARLLNTIFVNGEGAVTITPNPPDSCDVAAMTLTGLTQDVLDRLHRFVRLWRCLDWDIYDLDNAVSSLQSETSAGLLQLNAQLLRQLACAKAAMKSYSLPAASAVALFAPTPTSATIATRSIPTLPGDDEIPSLYAALFNNVTVLNEPDPIFVLNPAGTEIAAIATSPKLIDHTPALVAAFEISESDLALAIASFTDGNLTLANLSALYRRVTLAAVLGLTIGDLITLLAIIEAPVDTAPFFELVDPFDGTRPEALARFAAGYAMLRSSGLSISAADYIVRSLDDGSGVAPGDVAIGTLLLTLYNGLVKIATQYAFAPDPTGVTTRKALAKVLDTADVNTTMAILDGTTALSTTDQNSFIATALAPFVDIADAEAKLVAPTPLAAGQPRYEYLLHALLDYDITTLSNGLVIQTIGQALGLETATAAHLLGEWFPSATTTGAYLISDFVALGNTTLADTTTPILPTNPDAAPLFTAYATLAKTALLITTQRLASDDVNWWHTNGVTVGWLDPTTLPTTAQPTAAGRFHSLTRLIAAGAVRRNVPTQQAAFASLFAPGTSKLAYVSSLAAATQWPEPALEALLGDPTNSSDLGELSLVYPDDYQSEVALTRLYPCMAVLQQTGIPAKVSGWTATSIDSDAADAIKQSVKAQYPQAQWLQLAKALRDPLRELQRDALLAYLLANPPTGVSRWLDPDDVFAHFLLDVEMGACMETSRIVQATATVQLFVQRCFLNLEPNVTIDVTTDPTWLQWQWMSQYRVWQANREVFLYPENWIDPSLRSNASPFFTDLIQDLKQADLDTDAADAALQNYLEKLEAVARLDVCGTFHDLENGADVLHVLARTQGSPPTYYQRQWRNSAHWTAWEKVDLDIASEHILPLVWNGRPYLFWAIVTVKADQHNQPIPPAQTSSRPAPSPSKHVEIQLAWSQYKQGKWQGKQTAPQTMVIAWPPGTTISGLKGDLDWSDVTLKSSLRPPQLEIDVFLDVRLQLVVVETTLDPQPALINTPRRHVGAFVLGGAGTGVELFVADEFVQYVEVAGGGTRVDEIGPLNSSLLKPDIGTPTSTIFAGDWLTGSSWTYQSAARPRVGAMYTSYQLYQSAPSELVLSQADPFRLVIPHQTPSFDSTLPFFHRDAAREYFVVPKMYYQHGNYFTVDAPLDVYDPYYQAEYTFSPFYHPFVSLLISELNSGGVDALFNRDLQLNPVSLAGATAFDFASYYQPSPFVLQPYPSEGIDFESEAGYGLYNWELFYHAPFLIANQLSTNRRFADARHWYEYVFSPAGPPDPAQPPPQIPQRFWVTKPFYEMTAADYAAQQITALMTAINKHDATLEHDVAQWRADPFDPDAIAQLRLVAYQRAVVMRYIDNLIAWGDQLFAQDTRETTNLATQLYVLAADLLGPEPEIVPPLVEPEPKTYADLEGTFDKFSNALVAAENAIPPVNVNVPTQGGTPNLPTLSTLYFRIPPNAQLLAYWGTVADRLFKIRHCMNIEGTVQQLPLFAPPINPELLIAAEAAGLDLSSVLSDSSAAVPPYRFQTIIRLALELCDQVRNLGAELLTALEKRDAEALALIRSGAELSLQSVIADVRARQVDEAMQQIEVLKKAEQSYLDRENFYASQLFMNAWEGVAMDLQVGALVFQTIAAIGDATAAVAHALPTVDAGAAGAGGTPYVTVHIGGPNVAHAATSSAWVSRMVAAYMQSTAQTTATLGSYVRRQDEWTLQQTLARDEIDRIQADIVAATIRVDVATKEQTAQTVSLKQASDVDAFLHSKFTDKELYDWMVSQTATTYFQAYQLAYSLAKAAEQCLRRELAIPDSTYIQFGYWDSLRQGLCAGEKLHYDLRRLEAAYHTQNDRELEIVKHVSLLQLDPYQLVTLRETGSCLIDLPEILFDLDNPGHYMRRLKTVGLTIPCVVGPYTSASATLTLLANQIRTSTDTGPGYARTGSSDTRFLDDPGGASKIVTSTAQNDSGLFELRLQDERYLPFEYAGAISNWQLTLNSVYPQFDYSTISDVVLHLRYSARDGGATLATAAETAARSTLNAMALAASRTGLYRLFSSRHDYPTNWAQFLDPPANTDQTLTLTTPPERFQYFTNGLDLKIRAIDILAHTTDPGPCTLTLTTPTGNTQTVTMNPDPTLEGMHHIEIPLSPQIDIGRAPTPPTTVPPTWTIKLKQQAASDYRSLTADQIEDILLVVSYQATP